MADNGKDFIDHGTGTSEPFLTSSSFSSKNKAALFGLITFALLAALTTILVYQRYQITKGFPG